jgi:hypothetical protein
MFPLFAPEVVAHDRRDLGNAGARRGTSGTRRGIAGLRRAVSTLAAPAGIASMLVHRAYGWI